MRVLAFAAPAQAPPVTESAWPMAIVGLAKAVRAQNPPPVEHGNPADGAPRDVRASSVRVELRFEGVEGQNVALEVNRILGHFTAVELDLGGGSMGWQLGLLGRRYAKLAGDPHFLASFAVGPTLLFKSRILGNKVEREPDVPVAFSDIYYFAAISPQIAFEMRKETGLVVQVEIGFHFGFAHNFGRLCRFETSQACSPGGSRSTAEIARRDGYIHLGASVGWAW